MTAPSFQNFPTISDPFTQNGKQYIKVKNPRTSTVRMVRWYTSKEFAKAFPQKNVPPTKDPKPNSFEALGGYRHARGFDLGPILAIRNNREKDEPYLRKSVARFAEGVGWYIASTDSVPLDIPPHLKLIPLSWDEASPHIKNPETIAAIIHRKCINIHS